MKPTVNQLAPPPSPVAQAPLPPLRAGTYLPAPVETPEERKAHVFDALRKLGVGERDIARGETKYLLALMHPGEIIGGVIYGRADEGKIMLVATDRRVIYVDTKPFFKKTEDVSYDSVGGIVFEWVVFRGTLILQTRVGDFKLRIRNRAVAEGFRSYVESRCIERRLQG